MKPHVIAKMQALTVLGGLALVVCAVLVGANAANLKSGHIRSRKATHNADRESNDSRSDRFAVEAARVSRFDRPDSRVSRFSTNSSRLPTPDLRVAAESGIEMSSDSSDSQTPTQQTGQSVFSGENPELFPSAIAGAFPWVRTLPMLSNERGAAAGLPPSAGRTAEMHRDHSNQSSPRPSPRQRSIRTVAWQSGSEEFETGETDDENPPDQPQLPIPQPPFPGDTAPAPLADGVPPSRFRIPLAGPDLADRVDLKSENGLISLIVRDAPLGYVLELLARQQGLNIVAGHDVLEPISVTFTKVRFADALDAILSVAGYTWVPQRNIILITRLAGDERVLPQTQGRELQVFPLNFVAADDVQPVVEGLLSPVGSAFAVRTDPLDNRRTQEQIVVEDLPLSLARIAEYIARVDQPPRQVLVEVHILQVTLDEECRHGINFEYLSQLADADISVRTQGFADASASPAFIFDLNATELNAVVEALRTTTDAKTLASPKVLVLNGQEARIQIGEQLGYLVTTTTETSTLQNVNFLELGVVLRVTPTISDDNHVLLSVRPEVSSGQINEATGLPEESTTEVETTVLLQDGHGMVIGGLIKEEDREEQTKIPIVGSLWVVGRLFQRSTITRERNEIIIVLIPRIVPYMPDYQQQEDAEACSASTPLMYGPLKKRPRPWEARLPDSIFNPRWLKLNRIPDLFRSLYDPYPLPLEHYLPAADEVGSFHGDLLGDD